MRAISERASRRRGLAGASPTRYFGIVLRDTTATANTRYVELLRAQPPAARLAQAVRLTRSARELAEAAIRSSHRGASEREIRARLAARIYGPAVARRLFGDLADALR
jgi:hypothetical protein